MVNILSIDLEDYYMVSAFETMVKREDWHKYESRIERNTHRILDILNGTLTTHHSPLRTAVRATFFCLGWIAEKYPGLIKEIDRQGHEVSSHGYDHRLVYHMTPEEFRTEAKKSKNILEDLTGKKVIGYRAPSCSITEKSLWAFRILAEEGYQYDSSIFPIHHDRYGIPTAPRLPFVVNLDGSQDPVLERSRDLRYLTPDATSEASAKGHQIIEIPLSTVRYFGCNVPVSGGGYFRLFPYSLIKAALKKINRLDDSPFVIYLHPWEVDPDQPRMRDISAFSRFRHYINLNKTADKLKILLNDFAFSSMRNAIGIET